MTFTRFSLDLHRPPLDGFLSAVDRSMNSNTLLLGAVADVPVGPENQEVVFRAFLQSEAYAEALLDADRRRGWCNLSHECEEVAFERPLLREGFLATVTRLGHREFLARLRWMLCEAYSPYDKHYAEPEAGKLVSDFADELLDGGGSGWTFASVEPDFLRSTGYFSGEAPLPPVYFDGGDSDTATFFHRDRICYLLLTNGSP
ncbi:hypothetical protein [Streptomyces sp. NPDC020742]|uniref:hypothetical protein n=1 Tax=Streptomyces sp. NPDC020742 TaxID=3154897 RepID=UPI0034025F11